jgi:hypothetical protein
VSDTVKNDNDQVDVDTATAVDDTVAALIAAANKLPPLPEGWVLSNDPRAAIS